MTQITNGIHLVWVGVGENCTPIDLVDFSGKIRRVFIFDQLGTASNSSSPDLAGIGATFRNMECGTGHLVYSESAGIPYDIIDAIPADLTNDGGRIDLSSVNLVEQFDAPRGSSGESGTYTMTTSFSNNKPVYKNESGWYAVYNADSTWSLKDSITQPTVEYKNDNVNPSDGVYIQVPVGPVGPTGPTPTPTTPTQLESELLARWDAQYSSTDVYVEDPVGGYDFIAPSATIRDDLSGLSRGKVFTMEQTAHYCRLGNILNETFHSANFSISFWCNPNTTWALDQDACCYSENCAPGRRGTAVCRGSMFASKWYSSPSSYANAWIIYTGGAFVSDGSIRNYETTGKDSATRLIEGKSIPVNSGTWTHLLYSVRNGKVTIYMNGEDVTGSGADLVHTFDLNCSNPIVLGNIQTHNAYPGAYGYRGSLDDFRIYGGPLSEENAIAIYNSTDEESQRQPFNIPVVEVVETSVPMNNGIEKKEGPALIPGSQIFGMSFVGDEVAVAANEESITSTPQIIFYETSISGDSHFVESSYDRIDLSSVVSDASSVKHIKWVKSTNPERNILIVCTEASGIRVYKISSSGKWVSSRIGVNWTSSKNKLEYIEYDSPADDIIVVLDSAETMTSYRTASFGQWATFGYEFGVEGMAVDGKKLVLSYEGPLDSDIYDLRLCDITSRDDIPGVSSIPSGLAPTDNPSELFFGHQGSRGVSALALTISGDEVYASFTGNQSSRFRFDPNDDYLPSASPSAVYRFPEQLDREFVIFPPHRLSGIDYDHINKFGSGIHVSDKYMVITTAASDFAHLYMKSTSMDWEFVSRLVYGVVSPTPKCHIGDDYCIIHCGADQLDRLVYFKLSDSLSGVTDETLPIVDEDLVAWWDFGSKYGRLPAESHVVFDKSGYNNHLGIGTTYADLATNEIPGALASDKIYKFDDLSSPCVCNSPISSDAFTGNFTISVWFYRTNDSNRAVIFKRFPLSGTDYGAFTIYANGDMNVGHNVTGIPQLTTPIKSNEWTFLTLVRDGMIIKSYMNGQLSKSAALTEPSVPSAELQVASQGDIGYLDDIKIYKTALTSVEIREEFEKSYRHQLLTA